MATHNAERAPQLYARTAGVLVLLITVCAIFSMMYVTSSLIVPGDATATAANIRGSETLYRLGTISNLIIVLLEVALTVVLYVLLRPVSPVLSLIAATARLVMTALQAVNVTISLAVLLVLGGTGYLAVLEPVQLDALALLLLDVHKMGESVWLICFFLHCVVLGYLIFVSGYLPRALGALMVVAGFGYLANALAPIMFPAIAETTSLIASFTGFFGELPFFLWLLFKGVNLEKWHVRTA